MQTFEKPVRSWWLLQAAAGNTICIWKHIKDTFGESSWACLVGGVLQQSLMGSWWGEEMQLLLIPVWVLSESQVRVTWQAADPLNCNYELPCKWWWAWKGGTVTMGFNCSSWICLPTSVLHLQAPQAPVGEWKAGLWPVQHTSWDRCAPMCHWGADKYLCS